MSKTKKKPEAWARPLPRVLVTRAGERIGCLDDARVYMLALPQAVQLRPHSRAT